MKLLLKSGLLALAALLLLAPSESEAKTTCRSIGLTYNRATKRCNPGKKAPRYQGKGNKYCRESRPSAKPLNGVPASNNRVPYMQPQVHKYIMNLKQRCRGLRVESTFRSCAANRNARGMQRSKHLCGAAADTSNCGGLTAKGIPSAVCYQSGMKFINEGASRFPHCQMNISCP